MSSSGGLGGNGDVVVAEEADEADQGQSWQRAQSHVLESAGLTTQNWSQASFSSQVTGLMPPQMELTVHTWT